MRWSIYARDGRCLTVGGRSGPEEGGFPIGLSAGQSAELRRVLERACDAGQGHSLTLASGGKARRLTVEPIVSGPLAGQAALVVLAEEGEERGSEKPAGGGGTHPSRVAGSTGRAGVPEGNLAPAGDLAGASAGGRPAASENEQRLALRNRAILRSSMDGFFVVDHDCRFLEVNEAFCRMTGYSESELLSMRISDLEVAESRVEAGAVYGRTGLHHFPTAHRHKDGHVVHLEISINVVHDGGAKVLVGFARDVSERKRTEEALALLTWQHKLILCCAAEGIAGLDSNGDVTFINPAGAAMLGAWPGGLIGRPAHEVFLHEESRAGRCARTDCGLCDVLSRGTSAVRVERDFVRADGTRFAAEFSLSSMWDGTRPIGAVIVFKDMSQRRRAEEERRQMEAHSQQAQKLESLGLLAGGIAHDLNNMLVGILGNACLAQAQIGDDEAVRDRLSRVVGACERAAKVIRQILTYSGRVTCDAEPCELNALVEEMAEFMRAAVPKHIQLQIELEREPATIEADSGQFQQMLMNLLVNAVEAIGSKDGCVTVATHTLVMDGSAPRRLFAGQTVPPGRYACVSVSDDGCGMSRETLARVFEPFFSNKGAGRGLGLSAMLGVVRAHRGFVHVESEPGKGTRFTLAFPISTRVAGGSERPMPHVQRMDGRTALVVDDEAEVREVVEAILQMRGFRVLLARDGREGAELFRRRGGEIDVVILDMTMPGKSGMEVYREIMAVRPDARVVIASGHSEESLPEDMHLSSRVTFLRKPFSSDALVEKIASVLRSGGPARAKAGVR